MTDTIITLELSPKLQQEQIVTSFIYDLKTNNLILVLNHKYTKRVITSPVDPKWNKTIDTFEKQLKRKGVKQNHRTMLTNIADENAERILIQSVEAEEESQRKNVNS